MARIRGDCLRPEAAVKAAARAAGLRFAENDARLPGRPDLAFWDIRLAVFVNGCFWHAHQDCCRLPRTRRAWWRDKLAANRRRDARARRRLRRMGWRTATVWECRLNRRTT